MNEGRTDRVERVLLRWSRLVRRRARLIVTLGPLLSGLLAWHAAGILRVDTDTSSMVSDELDFRRLHREYEAAFPGTEREIVVVLTGATPWLAEDGTRRLAAALRAETDLFEGVSTPGLGEFWDRHGLLYLDADTLAAIVDRVETAAPLLVELEADPTLGGLARSLDRVFETGEVDEEALGGVLGLLTASTYQATRGRFAPVPWSAVVQGREPRPEDLRRTLTVSPRLEFENRVPGRAAVDRIREIADGLGFAPRNGVRVRLTGKVAIESEEIVDAMDGVVQSGVLALVLVSLILYLALRSARLIAVALITLAVGLVVTAWAAAMLVGELNLISVAFAVLYIGLGIDYAIHLILRYTSRLRAGGGQAAAIDAAVGEVGPSLGLSALTTAACFFAFIPTDFTGVSDLGVIGGVGMFVSFAVTITLLPALLNVFPSAGETPVPAGGLPTLAAVVQRHRRAILIAAGLATLFAAAGLPRARFDHNPLNLRDPASESVSAYRELLADPTARPLSVSAVRDDSASVVGVDAAVAGLDVVDGVRTVFDFVPERQAERLPLLRRIATALGPGEPEREPGGTGADGDPAGPGAWSESTQRLAAVLQSRRWGEPDAVAAISRQFFLVLRAWEREVASWPAEARPGRVAALERALFGGLTGRVGRLRAVGDAATVSVDALPDDLKRRWVAVDGRYRAEVLPAEVLIDNEPLRRFVDEVREVVPDVTGAAVSELETGRVAASAFRSALGFAGLVTVLLLFVLQRDARVVLYVAGPLLVAGLWTAGLTGWLDLPFNFANVIALPLLLGVGVDNGIHMVHQARMGRRGGRGPMTASTSRAVLFATLTTMASFGNLAFAVHVGMASMGRLLSLGMTCVLVATLVVLPALMGEDAGTTKAARVE